MNDVKLDFSDVLLVPQETRVESRSQVNLVTTIQGVHGASITGIPILAANMMGVGTIAMCEALGRHKIYTAIEKTVPVSTWLNTGRNTNLSYAFVTVGMQEGELFKLAALKNSGIFSNMKIVVDVANGHMVKFVEFVSRVRDTWPDAFILAGTVCTPEACNKLIIAGADLARVGIGTGAVCTTRMVAGTGYPQLSAIRECSRIEVGPYFDSKKLPIVCDGGCYHPGDFAKAFAAGAQMVMAGSVFAGHAEGGIQPVDGMVEFRGNAALPEPAPDGQTYRSSEGRIVKIPFKGSVNATVEHILGGLRSACSYSNALSLPELAKNAKFIRVNNQLNTVIERYTI